MWLDKDTKARVNVRTIRVLPAAGISMFKTVEDAYVFYLSCMDGKSRNAALGIEDWWYDEVNFPAVRLWHESVRKLLVMYLERSKIIGGGASMGEIEKAIKVLDGLVFVILGK